MTQNNTQTKHIKLLCLSLGLLALQGCQSLIGTTPTPNAQVSLGGYDEFGNVISTANTKSLADARWQSFYADARLKELIALGLENNRDLQSAALNIQKARAQYQISDNQDIPTIAANAGYTRSGDFKGNARDSYSVGLGMSAYEFDFWGRIRSLKEQALANYFATGYAKDSAQIALVSQIAQSWVGLSYAEAQLALAQKTLKSQEKSLDLNSKRFKAGIDPELTVVQARSQVAAAKLSIATSKTQIKQAKNALNLLVGQPVPGHLLPQAKVSSITHERVFNAGLPSQLLTYRPDIRGAELQLKAAGANIDAARAAYYPAISLTGNVGASSGELDKLFESGSFSWSLGPSITLPIFDAGRRDANLAVAEVGQQQALVNYEKSIQTAFKEVADVLAERATLSERISAQRQLLKSSERNYELSQLRFKAGIDSYLNVLDAQRALFNSEQALLNLQQSDLISQIKLYQVLGGGAEQSATTGVDGKNANTVDTDGEQVLLKPVAHTASSPSGGK